MSSSLKSAALRVSPPIDMSAESAPAASALIHFIFYVGLLFISGAFTLTLTSVHNDASAAAGSAVLQIVTALTGVSGTLLVFTSRNGRHFAIKCWPILAMVALAFLSSTWSFNRYFTLHKTFTLYCTVIFCLALVTRLSPMQCIQLILRVMMLACVLSIIWVIAFPETGMHQLSDLGQTQHAGQWRGIFSHKQGLGLFAGFTAGLLMFYGSMAFRSPIGTMFGLICAFVCLFGASSTTGWLTMILTAAVLYFLYGVVVFLRPGFRNLVLYLFLISILCGYLLWSYGFLYILPMLLGKTSNLTGRTDSWPIAMDIFYSSGVTLLGGGYSVGLQHMFPPYIYIDNGYIYLLIQFGYLGSAPVAIFVFWLLFSGKRLIQRAPRQSAVQDIFPMAMILILGFENYAEANFLVYKHMSVAFTVLALAIIVRGKHRSVPFKSAGVRTH